MPIKGLLFSLEHSLGKNDMNCCVDAADGTNLLKAALQSCAYDKEVNNCEQLRDQLCKWCCQQCADKPIGLPLLMASNTRGGRPTIDFESLLTNIKTET